VRELSGPVRYASHGREHGCPPLRLDPLPTTPEVHQTHTSKQACIPVQISREKQPPQSVVSLFFGEPFPGGIFPLQ